MTHVTPLILFLLTLAVGAAARLVGDPDPYKKSLDDPDLTQRSQEDLELNEKSRHDVIAEIEGLKERIATDIGSDIDVTLINDLLSTFGDNFDLHASQKRDLQSKNLYLSHRNLKSYDRSQLMTVIDAILAKLKESEEQSHGSCSGTNNFRCPSGGCIKASAVCDGAVDCPDGEDERNCVSPCQGLYSWQCPSGECIRSAWVCDGHDDCHDGADESGSTCRNPATSNVRVNTQPGDNENTQPSDNENIQPGDNEDCEHVIMDLVIVVDSSASVGADNFNLTKMWLRDLLDELTIAPTKVHVAIFRFSSQSTLVSGLTDHIAAGEKRGKLMDMAFEIGSTATHLALMDVIQHLRTHGRPGVPRRMLLVVDGRADEPGDTLEEAWGLREEEGVEIIAVGVGEGVDQGYLQDVASSPDHVLMVDSYSALGQVEASVRAVACADICKLPVEPGSCIGRNNSTRWHYNHQEGRCEQFVYGKCRGNANNFATEETCYMVCGTQGVNKGCGKWPGTEPFTSRIVGGEVTRPNEWPSICSLNGCGGTLVKNQKGQFYIITAAHCARKVPERYKIRCGIHSLNGINPHEQMFGVNKIEQHPDYFPLDGYYGGRTGTRLAHDIAIMELNRTVNETDYVRAACLPTVPARAGETGYAAGWGQTANGHGSDLLKDLERIIQSNEDCERRYRLMNRLQVNCTRDGALCAGSPPQEEGIGLGDSGGPLYINRGGLWALVGVTSFASDSRFDDGFADVYSHLDWINSIIN